MATKVGRSQGYLGATSERKHGRPGKPQNAGPTLYVGRRCVPAGQARDPHPPQRRTWGKKSKRTSIGGRADCRTSSSLPTGCSSRCGGWFFPHRRCSLGAVGFNSKVRSLPAFSEGCKMKSQIVALAVVVVLAAGSAQAADVFNMGGTRDPTTGTWTGQASLEFVTVGDPGNAADTADTATRVLRLGRLTLIRWASTT